MKQRKPTKTWERTRLQNLLRHKSGRYYARAFAGGKEVWRSFSVAEAKLDEFLREQRRSNSNGEVSSKMTFDQAAAIYLRSLGDNLNIKPRTREYWREVLAALLKSWLRLNETEAAQGYDAARISAENAMRRIWDATEGARAGYEGLWRRPGRHTSAKMPTARRRLQPALRRSCRSRLAGARCSCPRSKLEL